ncbi:MAG: hypothetical protein O3C15_12925 [Proteobacteria bacterium]|nr:hypothetical protein [Pseudomonadota bacterium]
MNSIAFIVVNYFSHEKIARLLATIKPQEGIFGIIVDNSANDSEYARLTELANREDIYCIQSNHNGGFSCGTNIGLRAAYSKQMHF